ncbi:hypothetical protein DH2020_029179 [Rehmannia glutinosa]|uniref:Uncharacterized protein n=1 Tax=Rehmannia glutinosa TaxID=99300 RepID=A0ABR0VTK4_REHGL
MALAEARAAWQRTANRCLVQEDAKRAPKLACCSSVSPSVKQADTGPTSAIGALDIPNTVSLPFNLNPSYSNLSPNSIWWLQQQQQPNCVYQKGLMDEHFNSVENNMETLKQEDVGELKVEGGVGCDVSKNANEVYFDSESSWIGAEKNTPWWRTADTDELASFVAQRSLDHIENCDLPRPQNTRIKKDVDVNMFCFGGDGISSCHHHSSTHLHTPGSVTAESSCRKHSMSAEGHLESNTDKSLRDIPTHENLPEIHFPENNASKAQLMEALRHSQTRAREAARAAKEASDEKEHVVKLVFRQASQLFAYKQWLQLLQLENMYLQFINNKNQSVSIVFPLMLPPSSSETQKSCNKSSSRKREKRVCPQCEVSKYAVVFALGLGLAGAGFLLGWTIGWILPTW